MLGHFLISNFSRKLPVDLIFMFISSLSPCTHFVSKCFHISNPSVCTFNIHHIDLYFCGIEPTCMFWRVMEFDLVSVSYTHLRAHETPEHIVCRLLLEKTKTPTFTV